MNLKEIKNIFENGKYFSAISIEDEFEIGAIINLWVKDNVDVSIEFNPDCSDNTDFYKASLKLIEEKLEWIDKNKSLICNSFIEEEHVFEGLNEDIEKQLSKKEKAKIGNLEFSAPLSKEEFSNSLYITYISFYVEDDEYVSCNFDLDAEPNYLFGHLANIEIDEDNEILMGGING